MKADTINFMIYILYVSIVFYSMRLGDNLVKGK